LIFWFMGPDLGCLWVHHYPIPAIPISIHHIVYNIHYAIQLLVSPPVAYVGADMRIIVGLHKKWTVSRRVQVFGGLLVELVGDAFC